jgi:hypothetical protein
MAGSGEMPVSRRRFLRTGALVAAGAPLLGRAPAART